MVTGDGAVGKVCAMGSYTGGEVADTGLDMSAHIIHDQCLPRRIHSYCVSHLLVWIGDASTTDDEPASTTTRRASWLTTSP